MPKEWCRRGQQTVFQLPATKSENLCYCSMLRGRDCCFILRHVMQISAIIKAAGARMKFFLVPLEITALCASMYQ